MLENKHLVVAIDFGTSRSGFAYAFRGDKEAHVNENWLDAPAHYPKTDTHVLYGPDNKVAAWGFEAMTLYASLRQKKQDRGYHFLSNFKMALYEQPGKTWENQRLVFKDDQRVLLKENRKDNQVKEFRVIDIIADYLCSLKDFALSKIRQETTGLLQEQEILWCLTVPAIWRDDEKQLMRRAAIQAGLIANTHEDAERLVIVLEPEAAAVHCLESDTALSLSELKPNTCFMVIDAGGGTVDITVHQVVSSGGQNSLEEVVTGLGGPYGSTYIDEQFKEYVNKKLGVSIVQEIFDTEPVAYRRMMSRWELSKCRFTGDKPDDVVLIDLGKIYTLLHESHPDALKRLAEEQDGTKDEFVLDNSLMHTFFRPVIDGVEDLVREQFALLGSRRCDFIFLVGGFSTSPLLQRRIREKFSSPHTKIVIPGEPGGAIEMGAASLGLDPSVIRARRTRLTYGIETSSTFEFGTDPESKKIENPKGGFLCTGRFTCFISAGQQVAFDQPIIDIFYPVYSNQREIQIDIYASRQKKIRYVEDAGTQKIGELTISRDDISKGYNWPIEVVMYFGKSEMQVEARDPDSGQKVRTELRFLTTYFPEFVGRNK